MLICECRLFTAIIIITTLSTQRRRPISILHYCKEYECGSTWMQIYGCGNVFRTLSIWREKIFIGFAHWHTEALAARCARSDNPINKNVCNYGCKIQSLNTQFKCIRLPLSLISRGPLINFLILYLCVWFFAFWFISSFSISKYKITYVLCTLGMPICWTLIYAYK